jgi:hypothetical protein
MTALLLASVLISSGLVIAAAILSADGDGVNPS